MIDFGPLYDGTTTMRDFARRFDVEALRRATHKMIDRMLALLAACEDADVTFQPPTPDGEGEAPWTLGHVIVHTTATAENSAALAAELARGVAYHGPSRYEVPWQTVTTVAQCRARLEESCRMRLASLDTWPDAPYLDNVYVPWPAAGEVNAMGRFLLGLWHDDIHLRQIEATARQARAARAVPT